jgi:hypothetical protein
MASKIRTEAKDALIQFLNLELNRGSTFVQSALLAHEDTEHHERAKESPIRAAETVEHFKSNIVKGKVRNEMGRKLTSLKKLIAAL